MEAQLVVVLHDRPGHRSEGASGREAAVRSAGQAGLPAEQLRPLRHCFIWESA